MAYCDFVVKYDPDKTAPVELTKRILYSIFIKRIKHKKPVVIFIGGDSGEGKSFTAIKLQQLLLEIQGLDIRTCFDAINIYTPLQYPEKLHALLFDKELKKINIVTMHEAREIVKAKNWQSFLTQSVADINAMSRTVKRLIIIIISQFIRDITTDIRYTLNFYCIVRRPKGKKARLYINVLWKDDRDLEKPRLRRRKLSGYLVYPNGKYKRYIPKYLELTKPDKDLIDMFEKGDYEAKASIIKRKLKDLLNEIKQDIGAESDKIKSMVEWYSTNTENLSLIGKRYKGKLRLSADFKKMHELNKQEAKTFEEQLNKKLEEKGILEKEDEVKEWQKEKNLEN